LEKLTLVPIWTLSRFEPLVLKEVEIVANLINAITFHKTSEI